MTQLNGVRKNFQFIFFLISATIKDVQRKILNWSKRHSWGKTSKMFQERKKIPNFFRHLLLSISNSFLNASFCAFFSIVHRYFGLAPHEEWKRKKKHLYVCISVGLISNWDSQYPNRQFGVLNLFIFSNVDNVSWSIWNAKQTTKTHSLNYHWTTKKKEKLINDTKKKKM